MVIHNDTYYQSQYTETEEKTLAVILCITMTLSLYGNISMLLVLIKNDKMWTSTNMLIGNLALSGVLVTMFSMPFSLTSVLLGKWTLEEGPYCKFDALVTSALLLATILTHTMISVDKYYAVVKPFSRAMTTSRTWQIIFSVWLIALIMTIVPLFNFGRYAYNPTTLVCGVGFPKKKKDTMYLMLLATVGFFIPNVVMVHIYTQVYRAVLRHSKRLQISCVTSFDVLQLQKRLILTVVFSLICFLACWTPFCVFVLMAIIVDTADDLPHGLGVSAYWCGYLYNAINPLIICSMSSRFGEGFYEFTISLIHLPGKCFKTLFCCRRKTLSCNDSRTPNINQPVIEKLMALEQCPE